MNDELAPKDLAEAKSLAITLSKASLLPDALRGKEADVLMTIMTGRELGLGPMQSIRAIEVIEGKPTLKAEAMVALVRARKDVCAYLTCDASDAKSATWSTQRTGDSKPTSLSWTMDQAKAAGLTQPTKSGRPSMYTKYPDAMLRWRAASMLVKLVYSDIILGLYTPEELTDGRGDERDVTPPRSVPSTGIVPQNAAQTINALTASIDAVKAADAAKTQTKPRLLQLTEDPKPDYGLDGAPVSERAKLDVAIEEAPDEAALLALVERIDKAAKAKEISSADIASIRIRWGARRDELKAAIVKERRDIERTASEATP